MAESVSVTMKNVFWGFYEAFFRIKEKYPSTNNYESLEGQSIIELMRWAVFNPDKFKKLSELQGVDIEPNTTTTVIDEIISSTIEYLSNEEQTKKIIDEGIIMNNFPYAAGKN